jgi:transcriptional regulator PpsR
VTGQDQTIDAQRVGELPESSDIQWLLEQGPDIAVLVSGTGIVEGVVTNPEAQSFGPLDRWIGHDFQDFLTIESRSKYTERTCAMNGDPDLVPRSLQLNHVDDGTNEFPVLYSIHRVLGRDAFFLFGRDLRPVAEVQQRLVAEQVARERDQEKLRSIEAFYRLVLEASETPLVLVEPESGRIRDLNSAAAVLLGSNVEALRRSTLTQAFEGGRKNNPLDAIHAAATAEAMVSVDIVSRRNGKNLSVVPQFFRAAGELCLLCKLVSDDTSARDGFEAAPFLAALFTEASDAIVLTDSKGIIRDANDAFLMLTDTAQIRDVKGKSLADFLARGTVDLKLILETTLKNGRMRSYSSQIASALGVRIGIDLSSTRLRQGGNDLGIGIIIRDVSPQDVGDVSPGDSVMSEEAMKSVMELVGTASLKSLVAATSDVIEKLCIETALELTLNNRVAAAEMLGLSRQSLYVKLRKYDLLERGNGGK